MAAGAAPSPPRSSTPVERFGGTCAPGMEQQEDCVVWFSSGQIEEMKDLYDYLGEASLRHIVLPRNSYLRGMRLPADGAPKKFEGIHDQYRKGLALLVDGGLDHFELIASLQRWSERLMVRSSTQSGVCISQPLAAGAGFHRIRIDCHATLQVDRTHGRSRRSRQGASSSAGCTVCTDEARTSGTPRGEQTAQRAVDCPRNRCTAAPLDKTARPNIFTER